MKRMYDLMVVLRPDLEISDEKKQRELLGKLVGSQAEVEEVKFLGKKPLAYEIKKFREAIYLLAKLSASQFKLAEIEKQVKLNADILRYLVTAR